MHDPFSQTHARSFEAERGFLLYLPLKVLAFIPQKLMVRLPAVEKKHTLCFLEH